MFAFFSQYLFGYLSQIRQYLANLSHIQAFIYSDNQFLKQIFCLSNNLFIRFFICIQTLQQNYQGFPLEMNNTGFSNNKFNQTGQSFGNNPASLKGKLQTLEQQIKNISNQLNNHKKQVQILRSEKDTLESVLTMKTADVKKSLSNELLRIEEEMKRHFNFQKAENSRIQQQITSLKGQKTALQQQLLGLQRRITELQMQVGNEGN